MTSRSVIMISVLVGVFLTLALAVLPLPQEQARAQSVPFTPTSTPSNTPTSTPTQTPTSTPVPTNTPWIVIATPTALPSTSTPTATSLPPGYGRDRCDPNHDLTHPCALATETDVTDLSFVDDSVDVFSFLLKGGRQYRLSATVGPQGGIDPAMIVYLAGRTDQAIAQNDDAQIGTASAMITLTVQSDAWYLVQVTNKAPSDPHGKTYTMSARSVSVTSPAATAVASNPDDLVGNAYDAAHAVPLAWGVPYDLSMRCPDTRPGACYDGRHTFLLVPIKRGIPFTAVTYDLGAGVDTVLTLYQPDASQQAEGNGFIPNWREVAANDDVQAGWTLRSQVTIIPTWESGIGLLVVAPSTHSDLPPIPAEGRPGRYRLIIGGPDLPAVKSVIQGQQDVPQLPTATLRPTSQALDPSLNATSAADTREVIKEACPTGEAEIHTATGLYAAAPPSDHDQIATYPVGSLVKLLGQCYRGWVKVQPADSVTPGWMWAPDLRPSEAMGTVVGATPTTMGSLPPTATVLTPGMDGTPTLPGDATATSPVRSDLPMQVTVLEPIQPSPTVAPRPVARQITISVCVASTLPGESCGTALSGIPVQLVFAATDQMLTSGITDSDGHVTLSVSVPTAATQLRVRLPSLGIDAPIATTATDLPIRIGGNG